MNDGEGCRARVVSALAAALLAVVAGCAGGPPPSAPGTGALYGTVSLVPPKGVRTYNSGASYGDRRLRGVTSVDYTKPGFVVVYLEGAPSPAGVAEIRLETTRYGTRLASRYAAVGVGGRVLLQNATAEACVFSAPASGDLFVVAAGGEATVPADTAGVMKLYPLSLPDVEAEVFVSPGPYAVAAESGRWELRDVPPGRFRLGAWHPRFPAEARDVEVGADGATRIDLRLGVAAIGR